MGGMRVRETVFPPLHRDDCPAKRRKRCKQRCPVLVSGSAEGQPGPPCRIGGRRTGEPVTMCAYCGSEPSGGENEGESVRLCGQREDQERGIERSEKKWDRDSRQLIAMMISRTGMVTIFACLCVLWKTCQLCSPSLAC